MKRICFVDFWPSLAAFAADIGVTVIAAKGIRRRERLGIGTIPATYWRRTVVAAAQRDIAGVTLTALAEAAERLELGRRGAGKDQRAA